MRLPRWSTRKPRSKARCERGPRGRRAANDGRAPGQRVGDGVDEVGEQLGRLGERGADDRARRGRPIEEISRERVLALGDEAATGGREQREVTAPRRRPCARDRSVADGLEVAGLERAERRSRARARARRQALGDEVGATSTTR